MMNGLRPTFGRSISFWRSSSAPTEALEVSIKGTSSLTSTLSVIAPTSNFTSRVMNSCVPMITLRSNFLKPAFSAESVYVAGLTAENTNSPSALLTVSRFKLVASSVISTLALAITAP